MKRQKGFSAVEGVFILLIVFVLCSVGYYVRQTNQKTDNSLNNAIASSSQQPQIAVKIVNGQKQFVDSSIPMTFNFPKNWSLVNETDYRYKNNVLYRLHAPEHDKTTPNINEPEIVIAYDSGNVNYAKDKIFESTDTTHSFRDVQDIRVDGREAFKNGSFSEDGGSRNVEVNYGPNQVIQIIYNAPATDNGIDMKYYPIYTQLLDSIKWR